MKNSYYFIKVLSVLFLLSGFSFIFTGKYFLALLAIASFVIIVFADSDWMFERLKVDNPNAIVIMITFVLIIINGYYINKELTMSSLMSKITTEQQKEYFAYEELEYKAFSPCMKNHNTIMAKITAGDDVSEDEIKKANSVCFDAVAALDKNVIGQDLPKSIIKLAEKNKSELKKIAVNLSSYNYSESDPQELLINRVKNSLEEYAKTTEKLKTLVNPKNESKSDNQIMIKI